jgi:hypothetical protein
MSFTPFHLAFSAIHSCCLRVLIMWPSSSTRPALAALGLASDVVSHPPCMQFMHTSALQADCMNTGGWPDSSPLVCNYSTEYATSLIVLYSHGYRGHGKNHLSKLIITLHMQTVLASWPSWTARRGRLQTASMSEITGYEKMCLRSRTPRRSLSSHACG